MSQRKVLNLTNNTQNYPGNIIYCNYHDVSFLALNHPELFRPTSDCCFILSLNFFRNHVDSIINYFFNYQNCLRIQNKDINFDGECKHWVYAHTRVKGFRPYTLIL